MTILKSARRVERNGGIKDYINLNGVDATEIVLEELCSRFSMTNSPSLPQLPLSCFLIAGGELVAFLETTLPGFSQIIFQSMPLRMYILGKGFLEIMITFHRH